MAYSVFVVWRELLLLPWYEPDSRETKPDVCAAEDMAYRPSRPS